MKKTTSLKLSKRLTKYSALTVAIAGVAEVNGQIDYTDIAPDYVGSFGVEYFLDLDSNGVDDFKLHTYASSSSSQTAIVITPLNSNDVLGTNPNLIYPSKLNQNDPISSGGGGGAAGWNNGAEQVLNYGSSNTCSNGVNWCSVTDGFLGLRFKIAGAVHYGWARLDTGNGADGWTVKDMAYNLTPDETILAGAQTLSVDTNVLNNVRIVTLDKSIGLYNLSNSTDFKIYAISGKQILDGAVSSGTSFIQAETLASGVYIIELTDVESKSIIRKKIVL